MCEIDKLRLHCKYVSKHAGHDNKLSAPFRNCVSELPPKMYRALLRVKLAALFRAAGMLEFGANVES